MSVVQERAPLVEVVRPALAAGLSAAATGVLIGGIFGTWSARLLAGFAALGGAAWAVLAARARRTALVQGLLAPVALVVGLLALIPAAGSAGPSQLPRLIGDAVRSGRLLRPPIPFDAGWRPVLVLVLAVIGFAAAWVAVAFERPKLGIAAPLPLAALAAISQPNDGEVTAGISAFVLLLLAAGVLFGGDARQAAELGAGFEMRRAVRALAAGLPLVLLLVAASRADALFPKPVYDPEDKPQKPKPVPLSATRDRVLFEVRADPSLTGPWRMGVLDVYDGEAWRLPPFDEDRLVAVPGSGLVDASTASRATLEVTFVIRDLGDSAAVPNVSGTSTVSVAGTERLAYDSRSGTVRVIEGRVNPGLTYTVRVPPYPNGADLEGARPVAASSTDDLADALEAPPVPGVIRALLESAPANPWKRLDFLRRKLADVVVAVGAGTPVDVPPERVVSILSRDHEATPFEIVASEALLARWAGVPARIGFGFDGLNDEGGVFTVRPRNAAQFLEAYFAGYGWVPLTTIPPKAKATLDTDPNARLNPTIKPSDEVAVEIYLPFELETIRLLYQRVRDALILVSPFVALLLALYLSYPAAARAWRRHRRRRWAERKGPRAQIAVEYAELRDSATDLNVGDPYATPLEFLAFVAEDEEHDELSWLVARSLYGDLAGTVTAEDVEAAREMSASIRSRLSRAQPLQSRVAGFISRSSLRRPYTTEVPNVRISRSIRPGGRRERALAKH